MTDFPSDPILAALAPRWCRRERFVVVLESFGDGSDFLDLWARWRADPDRAGRLEVIALDTGGAAPVQTGPLADALRARWPVATPDLHTVRLDDDRVRLRLAFGEARRFWRELVAPVDAFCLRGDGADARTAASAVARLARPGADVFVQAATPDCIAALRACGVTLECAQDGRCRGRYSPRFTPRRGAAPPAPAADGERHALIIGAGLAGAATARALAAEGWSSTVLERCSGPAAQASGNPAGLFHGIVTADDGPHARFNRAAALRTAEAVADAIARHGVPGSPDGLLRLGDADGSVGAMAALLARLGLPPGYVRALDAAQATRLAGLPLDRPAWWYPQGGWVSPSDLVRAWLADAGAHCRFHGGVEVARLARHAASGDWQAFDRTGQCVARSAVVVLANAGQAGALLGCDAWRVQAVRGQISSIACPEGVPAPRVPAAAGGYVMPPLDGRLLFGATAQPGDLDTAVREADHRHNLARLQQLIGPAPEADVAAWTGRTGWRCVSEDRLPLVGAVPDFAAARHAAATRLQQVPRARGLYVLSALGSRGITWSVLCGEVVAAAVADSPAPLPSSLLDALDPARFLVRAARRERPAKGALR